jgi:hypothetical protein
MKLVPLESVFDIQYGNQFDLYQLNQERGYIDFVSRSEQNCGVSAKVVNFKGVEPFKAGAITVALGGSVLASFVQQNDFYTAQNIKVLIPKRQMTILEKLYYCLVIKQNRYRYSALGREANKTLNTLLIPSEMPIDYHFMRLEDYQKPLKKISTLKSFYTSKETKIIPSSTEVVALEELFSVTYGVNMELYKFDECKPTDFNAIPFVSRTEKNNGVSAWVEKQIDYEPNPAHTLSVAGGGSVLATFYQPKPYYSGRDLYYLTPKREMSVTEMLYYAMIIRANRYRYSYGRQANKTLKHLLIPKQMPESLRALEQVFQ